MLRISLNQRVRVRDEVWLIESQQAAEGRMLFQLRSEESGQRLAVLAPPDVVEIVPGPPISLDRRALSPFGVWQLRHELIRLAAVRDSLSAVFGGRIQLEPYQLVPVTRLLADPRRSILIADDVGLGKTIEAGLCLIELIARGIGQRILLVVPPGLIDQWIEEMDEKFALAFRAIEDSAALDHAQTTLAEGISPWSFHDRIITSTEYLKRPEIYTAALRRPWDAIVVDEAHYLAESGSPANPYATKRTLLGSQLRKATRSLILLTATPHNGYRHSFRSLLELIEPTDAALVGNQSTVRRRIGRSMVRRLKRQITRSGPNGVLIPAFEPRAAVQRLDVHCATAEEREIFALVTRYCTRTAQSAARGEKRDLISFAMQIVKKRMLSSRLALARTIENRLEALKQAPDDEGPTRAELRELESDLPLSEPLADRLVTRIIRSSVPEDARQRNAEKRQLLEIRRALQAVSGCPDPKIERLLSSLRASVAGAAGEKAIVFTEYLDTLEAIRNALAADAAFADRVVELTGGLRRSQRMARMAAFARPDSLVMLATDAASEGLNLQDHCRLLYHMELPWNPNRLEQRNGRIDRYGQSRTPRIAYFFYADSPEDRVLDRLVARISQMQDDRVSTPDIVGVLEAMRLPQRILAISDDDAAELAGESLIRVFDEAESEFGRDVAPLLAAGRAAEAGTAGSTSADPLLDDDLRFESAMLRLLRGNARPTAQPHVYSVAVPWELQAAAVATIYPALTFRRSTALAKGMEETEFVSRVHPLGRAAAAHARALLIGSTPGVTLPPCSAVRRLAGITQSGLILTFFNSHEHPSGRFVAAGAWVDGTAMTESAAERALEAAEQPGDVPWDDCLAVFGAEFAHLRERCVGEARHLIAQRTKAERERRESHSQYLREELDAYRSDRLEELNRQEAAERADHRDQTELFGTVETDWSARRAAVDTHVAARQRALEEWALVPDAPDPDPLGMLLVVPLTGVAV